MKHKTKIHIALNISYDIFMNTESFTNVVKQQSQVCSTVDNRHKI